MQPEKAPQRVLAVFDFDGTLTHRHTFWRYLRFIHGPYAFWSGMLLLLPQILAVVLKIMPVMAGATRVYSPLFSKCGHQPGARVGRPLCE